MKRNEFMKAYNLFYDEKIKTIKRDESDVNWKMIRLWRNLSKEEQSKYFKK